MKPSTITDTLIDNLSFRAERQKVISSNIANINTPKYKAKDLVFEDELKKANAKKTDLQLTKTNQHHLPQEMFVQNSIKPKIIDKKGIEQNDGNNVNLDNEMSEMAKNNVAFEAIQAAARKDSNWFRLMLDSSSKM